MSKVKYYYKTDLFNEKRFVVRSKYKTLTIIGTTDYNTDFLYRNKHWKPTEYYKEITKKEFNKQIKKIKSINKKRFKLIYNETNL